MSRSHPPSLLRLVERCLKDECPTPEPLRIGLAVSGGPDSMAMMHAMAWLQRRRPLELLVLTCNHGFRPEAQAETQLVAQQADRLGLKTVVLELGLGPGPNLQERAREARRSAMLEVLEQTWGSDALLATAHHADDRAETVLLRLLRGCSLAGLNALPPREGRLLRPLIRAHRADILSHLERHQLPCVQDPSNTNLKFARVQVRQVLLPMLREMSPGIVEHLCALADEVPVGEALGLLREQRLQLRRALQHPEQALDLPLGKGWRLVHEAERRRVPEQADTVSAVGTRGAGGTSGELVAPGQQSPLPAQFSEATSDSQDQPEIHR